MAGIPLSHTQIKLFTDLIGAPLFPLLWSGLSCGKSKAYLPCLVLLTSPRPKHLSQLSPRELDITLLVLLHAHKYAEHFPVLLNLLSKGHGGLEAAGA